MTADEKYMKEALRQAKKAEALLEVPIGCVIVQNDKIQPRTAQTFHHCGTAGTHECAQRLLASGQLFLQYVPHRLSSCVVFYLSTAAAQ